MTFCIHMDLALRKAAFATLPSMPNRKSWKWLGLLSLWAMGCGDNSTAPGGTVELNTLEYSGKFRQYDKAGLVVDRDLDAQEIRKWRHREIHVLLDTLRLTEGKFEFVANDVVWESDSTDVGVDRFKTFRGDYATRGDSLYLAVNQPQYFGRDTLAFRYQAGTIRIEYCHETLRDSASANYESMSRPGVCVRPDVNLLFAGEFLQQEDVVVLFR